MNLRYLYAAFCILGLALPYSQFVPWVIDHGFSPALFFHELFANRVSTFFGLDVLVSSVVLISFASSEGARLRMRHLWLPVVAVCLVGVSLGLPLFLYMREAYIEQSRN